MDSDIEFIKSVANVTVKKYCRKYNVDYSNLLKGFIKDKTIIKKIREEIEEELKGILKYETKEMDTKSTNN